MRLFSYLSKKIRELIAHEVRNQLILHQERLVSATANRTKLLLEFCNQSMAMKEKNMTSRELGISKREDKTEEVIVSLTTFGKRFYDVYLTIESIMQGSVKPNRIILWLADDMKDVSVPSSLQRQVSRGLEIKYYKDIRSYKKLIPTIKEYPEAIIVTLDDDMIYEPDLLENLLIMHKKYPEDIIANRIHRITLDNSQKPETYFKWNRNIEEQGISTLNVQTGCGGVLYPEGCLDLEVLNEDVFMNICPYADDLWFYAMARKKNVLVRRGLTHSNTGEDYYENLAVQDVALWNTNSKTENTRCQNDVQFEAILSKYNLYDKLKS